MSYVGAPYNFVPLGKKVYRKDEITKHSEISGLSGYLEYQVIAKTPIIVDGGDKIFIEIRMERQPFREVPCGGWCAAICRS